MAKNMSRDDNVKRMAALEWARDDIRRDSSPQVATSSEILSRAQAYYDWLDGKDHGKFEALVDIRRPGRPKKVAS